MRIKGASKLPREFWQRMRMLQVPILSAYPNIPVRPGVSDENSCVGFSACSWQHHHTRDKNQADYFNSPSKTHRLLFVYMLIQVRARFS